MADVSIVESNKKKLKAKQVWNSMTFAELMRHSPKDAAIFAVNCNVNADINGVPAKDYISGAKEDVVEDITPPAEDKKEENVVELEISDDDLRELLKANNIEFHPKLWNKKLMKLASDNKLL